MSRSTSGVFSLQSIVVVLCCIIFSVLNGEMVAAQSNEQWTPRARIPGIHDVAETPIMLVDQNRTVHAFHAYPVEEDSLLWAIYYSRWTTTQGWTQPVDVLLSTDYLISVRDVFLDEHGFINLVYYCCSDLNPSIYYSRAPATIADRAPAWTPPVLIGGAAKAPATAAIAGDGQNNLWVLYGGSFDGAGIYALSSMDAGDSWSEPVPVFLTYNDAQFLSDLTLLRDEDGRYHATWLVSAEEGYGFATFYARLESDLSTWSEPIALSMAGETINRVNVPSLILHNNELVAMSISCEPCERRMRRSGDGGISWTDPVEPFQPSRGDYGITSLVVDGANQLHAVFGDRSRGETLWHSIWRDSRWLPPQPVVPLAEAEKYAILGDPLGFTPNFPNIVVSQGNVLLVTWTSDPGSVDNGSWYSFHLLDAPELPVIPLPESTIAILPTTAPVVMAPTPIPSRLPPLSIPSSTLAASETSRSEPVVLMMIGIAPVVLLVLVVLSMRFYARSRNDF